MILDLPLNVEQQLIQTAQQQGVTVEQLLLNMLEKQPLSNGFDFIEPDGIITNSRHELSSEHLQAIYDDLDNVEPNQALQALIQQYGGLNVSS